MCDKIEPRNYGLRTLKELSGNVALIEQAHEKRFSNAQMVAEFMRLYMIHHNQRKAIIRKFAIAKLKILGFIVRRIYPPLKRFRLR